MSTTTRNLTVSTAAIATVLLAFCAAFATPAHASGFYGPRNTIPVDPLPAVKQTCGAVFALSLTGPRPPRFLKVQDLGPGPIRKVERWAGPRATIPVYKQ